MGAVKVLVSGAAGYLGREVVTACLSAGHHVAVVLRDAKQVPIEWDIDQRVEIIVSDLNDLGELPDGVNVIAHLAASMTGSDAEQEKETVQATRHLLSLCTQTTPAIVLASSLSVYSGTQANGMVTERSQIEPKPEKRDAYCRAKLAQEKLCQDYATRTGVGYFCLRIGAIWGPNRLWNAHMGIGAGPTLFFAGPKGQVPLCHRRHAAQAIALSVPRAHEGHSNTLNVLDSDLPERDRYLAALRANGWPRFVVPLPTGVLKTIARLTGSRLGFGLLRLPVLMARLAPLYYDNGRLVLQLGWRPEQSFNFLMTEAIEASDG